MSCRVWELSPCSPAQCGVFAQNYYECSYRDKRATGADINCIFLFLQLSDNPGDWWQDEELSDNIGGPGLGQPHPGQWLRTSGRVWDSSEEISQLPGARCQQKLLWGPQVQWPVWGHVPDKVSCVLEALSEWDWFEPRLHLRRGDHPSVGSE